MIQFFSYWGLLTQYINPVKIIWSGILTSILAFVVAIILLVVFRKKVLIKRRYIILKCLAIAYLIFLPLFSAYTGFKWGILHGLQKDIIAHLPTYTQDLDAVFRSSLTDDVAGMPTSLSTNEYIDLLAEIVYSEYITTIDYLPKEGFHGKLVTKLHSLMFTSTIANYTKRTIHKWVKKKVGLDEKVTKEVMEVKLNELLRDGLFNKIAAIYVKKIIGGMKNSVLLVFVIIVGLPLVEIVIAVRLNRKVEEYPT